MLAQHHVLPGFEYPQGWRPDAFSRHPVLVFQIQEAHYVLSQGRWASLSLDQCSILPSPPLSIYLYILVSFLWVLFSRLSNPSCLSAPPCITLLQVFNHQHCFVLALLQCVTAPCPGKATPVPSILNVIPLVLSRSLPLTCLGLPLSAGLYGTRPFSVNKG